MYFPLYIPKSVILGFFIVVGCTLGWMLHGSANEVARAELRAPVMLQSSRTVDGPLPSTRAQRQRRGDQGDEARQETHYRNFGGPGRTPRR